MLGLCSAIYCFEINPATLTEPAWELLSCLESYLSKKHRGLIYAAGDGVYDANLTLIVKAT